MKLTDSLGRRRRPAQTRGLRPLFPKLPDDRQSRLIRIAMSHRAWEQFDTLAVHSLAPTQPRAYGELLERLLDNLALSPQVGLKPFAPTALANTAERARESREDWQAWQIQKESALLAASDPEYGRTAAAQWVN